MEILATLLQIITQTIEIYSLLLIVRILLSWFPNLDWSNPVLSNISAITDPYLNLFRGIIPMIGGLDISPILAFVVIRVIQGILGNAAALAMGGLQMYG